MEQCWKGKPVADEILRDCAAKAAQWNTHGIVPKLGVVRIGSRDNDLLYENGIVRACQKGGVILEQFLFGAEISEDDFCCALSAIAARDDLHGILVFFPLPPHISEARVRRLIPIEKDVDCLSPQSACGLYCGSDDVFPPCTPHAVIEMLRYYGVSLEGKDVTVIGRSMVVGRPLALLLLKENATVTLCHSRTENLEEKTRRCDILIAALGRPRFVDSSYIVPGQIVIDVGIHEVNGMVCGDVDFDSVVPLVSAITPALGGIGSITSAVLVKHTMEACMKKEV